MAFSPQACGLPPLGCLSHLSLIAFTALWNLAHYLCVCLCVCLYVCLFTAETLEETKGLAIAGPQCPGNARLAKGTVTCLSVSTDLFQLQASRSIRHVMSTACCLRASCHKPPVRNVDSGHNTLHTVANDQSACLRTPRV